VHVDPAGRDEQAICVDDATRMRCRRHSRFSDVDDDSAVDHDISRTWWRAAAVDESGVPDDEIGHDPMLPAWWG
jgi:hypothetical protein